MEAESEEFIKPTKVATSSGIELPERRALSLIYYDDTLGFQVSDEATQFLKSIK